MTIRFEKVKNTTKTKREVQRQGSKNGLALTVQLLLEALIGGVRPQQVQASFSHPGGGRPSTPCQPSVGPPGVLSQNVLEPKPRNPPSTSPPPRVGSEMKRGLSRSSKIWAKRLNCGSCKDGWEGKQQHNRNNRKQKIKTSTSAPAPQSPGCAGGFPPGGPQKNLFKPLLTDLPLPKKNNWSATFKHHPPICYPGNLPNL